MIRGRRGLLTRHGCRDAVGHIRYQDFLRHRRHLRLPSHSNHKLPPASLATCPLGSVSIGARMTVSNASTIRCRPANATPQTAIRSSRLVESIANKAYLARWRRAARTRSFPQGRSGTWTDYLSEQTPDAPGIAGASALPTALNARHRTTPASPARDGRLACGPHQQMPQMHRMGGQRIIGSLGAFADTGPQSLSTAQQGEVHGGFGDEYISGSHVRGRRIPIGSFPPGGSNRPANRWGAAASYPRSEHHSATRP